MNKSRVLVALALILIALSMGGIALAANALAKDGYEMPRHVIGGGGGAVTAGGYALHSTLGQAVVGDNSGASYDLCTGFWCGLGRYTVYLPLVLRDR